MLEGCTPWPEDLARRYVTEGYWEAKTIAEFLAEAAREVPERVVVSDGPREISYQELDQLACRLAIHLLHVGFCPRDIALLQLPNVWEFAVVFFALHKIGVIPVMCLPVHRHAEMTYFAQLTGAKSYFLAPQIKNFDCLAMAREIQAAAPNLKYLVATGSGAQPGIFYLDPWLREPVESEPAAAKLADCRPDPFDVAVFLLSGGTTGIPKLIPRTHADYLYNGRQCARALEWDSSVVFLIVIPAAHNFPLSSPGMLGAICNRGRVVMCPSTEPEVVFESIQRHKVTVLAVSPALLIMLLNSPHRERYDLSSLRLVCAGGQKMLPELADRTRRVWSHATPVQVFGMAEGLINLTRPDDPWDVIQETQGRPASPADEIKVVDESGDEVTMGEVGELITRGPYTIRGYYKAEEHNRAAFTPEGFYRTGDMVRRHPTGNLVVEGRRKDMINRGGEKISAEEIENLILGHESVHMTAVVAMPDPVMGEKSCAFVIPKPERTLTLEELTSFLRSKKIATFKLPERLEIVQSFPLTGVGKVSKKDLRDQIAAQLRGEGNLSTIV